ncbi:MAG: methyltransferase domain-containing protein [Deltaproteobacteria bacterium]|nr:methyltransferase domain-containing protein [Deltaproteobacteria bacterium]
MRDSSRWPIPDWAMDMLACPTCKGNLSTNIERFLCPKCGQVGIWKDGILRFSINEADPSISWYTAKNGTQFQERAKLPFTMSSLDTLVYHSYLERIKPANTDSVIVDVGAGDGRNTEPWLRWGYKHIVAIDPVLSSLKRFQSLMYGSHPEWIAQCLLIQGEARHIPIASQKADLVFAIESLYYLSENYELGLAECGRVIKNGGLFLTSERAWEGALLSQLLYGGVQNMIMLHHDRYMLEGLLDNRVRLRTFTEDELLSIIKDAGLVSVEIKGISVLSVVLGYLRGQGKISIEDEKYIPEVINLLQDLMDKNTTRRTHIVLARKE